MKALLFLFYVLSLQAFMIGPFMVEGVSMEPNFHHGEMFLIDENISSISDVNRGDVIVFSLPKESEYYYIKRVIGLPGERVSLSGNGVFVDSGNGYEELHEAYLPEGSDSTVAMGSYRQGYSQSYSVPSDSFFVLGDNREHSMDSRYFDFPYISLSDIKGKFLINLYTYEQN